MLDALLVVVCRRPALFEGLEVDQYVWAIIQHISTTSPHTVEVIVDHTASWRPTDHHGQYMLDHVLDHHGQYTLDHMLDHHGQYTLDHMLDHHGQYTLDHMLDRCGQVIDHSGQEIDCCNQATDHSGQAIDKQLTAAVRRLTACHSTDRYQCYEPVVVSRQLPQSVCIDF